MLLQQLPKLLGRVRVRGGHQIRRGLPGVKEEHIFHGHRLNDRNRKDGYIKICERYIKYVNIWRESTFNIQHSTYVKYEGSQRRWKTFWLLWWQAKPFWELPEFWAVNTFQAGNAYDQINTDFISAPLPKSWRWGMPTQIPCWELLEINQKKTGRRERQGFVHEKKSR